MNDYTSHREKVDKDGFTIIDRIYSSKEINSIVEIIDGVDQFNTNFRKTDDLFAIRRFLKYVPEVKEIIFSDKLKQIIHDLFGTGYFVVKSIYFDKPQKSNWFVAWHQDLTISVDKKIDFDGYTNWTLKPNQYAVQPPVNILQNNFTVRIHLDDTDKDNGALNVIPGSHLKNIYKVENIDWSIEKEATCEVGVGGIMIMRPLLLHSSNRTLNNKKRRVVHIEFSNANLAKGMDWAEKEDCSVYS